MSRPRLQAPKGTRDILPPETLLWSRVEEAARRVFAVYGFREIRTPILEESELFVRGVGESSDIVGKEMYRLTDKGGRDLVMRPESTAAVCRAYVEHGMQSLPQPVRLFYIGPQFRYERPQKGRYRQFHQIGAELLGGRGEESDLEVIALLMAFFRELGFEDLRVKLNTVGDAASRARYREALLAYLEPLADRLGEDSRRRLATNPLRILDTKSAAEQELLLDAPRLEDSLTDASRDHWAAVRRGLEALGIPFAIDPRLVRGLDYYTNTVFEIVAAGLGAQDALCGGGAYEGLVEELGGRSTYGVGFAIGQDRLIDVLPAATRDRLGREAREVLVAHVLQGRGEDAPRRSEAALIQARRFAEALRAAGVPAIFLGELRAPGQVFKAAERMARAGLPGSGGARAVAWVSAADADDGRIVVHQLDDGSERSLAIPEAFDSMKAGTA